MGQGQQVSPETGTGKKTASPGASGRSQCCPHLALVQRALYPASNLPSVPTVLVVPLLPLPLPGGASTLPPW